MEATLIAIFATAVITSLVNRISAEHARRIALEDEHRKWIRDLRFAAYKQHVDEAMTIQRLFAQLHPQVDPSETISAIFEGQQTFYAANSGIMVLASDDVAHMATELAGRLFEACDLITGMINAGGWTVDDVNAAIDPAGDAIGDLIRTMRADLALGDDYLSWRRERRRRRSRGDRGSAELGRTAE